MVIIRFMFNFHPRSHNVMDSINDIRVLSAVDRVKLNHLDNIYPCQICRFKNMFYLFEYLIIKADSLYIFEI